MTSRRRLVLLVPAMALVGLSVFEVSSAQRATAAPAAVVDGGGVVLSHRASSDTGALGVTFGFESNTLVGKSYEDEFPTYNWPMYEAGTGSTGQFWLNYVEELVSAGVDYVAVDTRGYLPGSSIPNEGGDPRELTELVTAINEAGDAGKLKIAALDDTPASMTDKMNQTLHHNSELPFDFSVTTGSGNGGFQYLWNNDLEAFFQAVPSTMLYKVDGRPLIYLWSTNSPDFTNQGNGDSARYLSYVRGQAEAGFGENPYFVVDESWIKNDPTVAPLVQGEDDWFGVDPSYTSQPFGGRAFGVTVPGFEEVDATTDTVIDPNHGAQLITGLENTVGVGDDLTLVEGFTDVGENAALWRTEPAPYGTTHRDYANQDINILRRYSDAPFPATLTVQAETADLVAGSIANPWEIYRDDLAVQVTTDVGGGWNVGAITGGENLAWEQLPMQNTDDLKIRVASPLAGSKRLRFVIDGVAGPTISVPDTGGWQSWQTIDAGTFQFKAGTYHTVQLQFLTGGFNVNWWQAVNG
jgi:hypothetical protein